LISLFNLHRTIPTVRFNALDLEFLAIVSVIVLFVEKGNIEDHF
jgi:hypothetical protein